MSKFTDFGIKVLLILASFALLAMMCVITVNVLGRISFNSPLLGALEIAGLAGVVMVSVALGYTEREKSNVVVEVFASRFPPRIRAITDSITLCLSLVAVSFLFWAVCEDAFHAAAFKEQTLILEIDTPPFKFIWAAGTFFLCLCLLKNMVTAFKKALKK